MSLSACSLPFNKMDKDKNNENSEENSNNEKTEAGEADLNALLGYDAEKLLNTEEVKDFEDIVITILSLLTPSFTCTILFILA